MLVSVTTQEVTTGQLIGMRLEPTKSPVLFAEPVEELNTLVKFVPNHDELSALIVVTRGEIWLSIFNSCHWSFGSFCNVSPIRSNHFSKSAAAMSKVQVHM